MKYSHIITAIAVLAAAEALLSASFYTQHTTAMELITDLTVFAVSCYYLAGKLVKVLIKWRNS